MTLMPYERPSNESFTQRDDETWELIRCPRATYGKELERDVKVKRTKMERLEGIASGCLGVLNLPIGSILRRTFPESIREDFSSHKTEKQHYWRNVDTDEALRELGFEDVGSTEFTYRMKPPKGWTNKTDIDHQPDEKRVWTLISDDGENRRISIDKCKGTSCYIHERKGDNYQFAKNAEEDISERY